jgi:hypothetical protein
MSVNCRIEFLGSRRESVRTRLEACPHEGDVVFLDGDGDTWFVKSVLIGPRLVIVRVKN